MNPNWKIRQETFRSRTDDVIRKQPIRGPGISSSSQVTGSTQTKWK